MLTFKTTAQHVKTKLYAKYFTKIPLMVKVISQNPILSMFFLSLNSRNSITIAPIDMKLDVWTGDSYIVSGPLIVMLTLLLYQYIRMKSMAHAMTSFT